MSSVVLDSEVLARLRQAEGRVEIRDKSGAISRLFHTTAVTHSPEVSLYRDVEVPFTDQDLDRFESEPGGRTLGPEEPA